MTDRVPAYPGRVKVTKEDGSVEFVTLERADDPTQVGTPLNKKTFLTDTTGKALGLPPADDPTVNDALLAIANGQGGIGDQLHTNWYFRAPINQRGNTSYTAAGYTIDMWILSNPGEGITLGAEGITVLSAGTEWSQRVNGISAYAGQPMTLSMLLADGTLHTGTVEAINWSLETPQTVFDDDVMSCTITQIDTNLCEVTYTMKTAGLVLVAAKMEMRFQQTLARESDGIYLLNDTQPNLAIEYIKCLYYYRPNQEYLVSGYGVSKTFYCQIPVLMRAIPRLTVNNSGSLSPSGSGQLSVKITRNNSGILFLVLTMNGSGSLTSATVWNGNSLSLSSEP